MPAHLPPRVARARAPRTTWLPGLALTLVVALVLGACGGKSPEKKQPEARPSEAASSPADEEPADEEPADEEPADDPGYGAPKVGECHRMTAARSRASVATSRKVRCRAAHTSVVAQVAYLPKPVTPATPVARRQRLGQRLCQPAYERAAGGTLADRAISLLTWALFTPGQAQLERGARWVRCDVIARSGGKLVPLPSVHPVLARGVPDELRICQDAAGTDVSCTTPHAFRVTAVFLAVGDAYPNVGPYTRVARARCRQLLGTYGGYWQPPSRAGWNAGDRFIRCLTATQT